MATNTPAYIREWLLLVLGSVGEVTARVPLVGLCVNLGVEMDVIEEIDLGIISNWNPRMAWRMSLQQRHPWERLLRRYR